MYKAMSVRVAGFVALLLMSVAASVQASEKTFSTYQVEQVAEGLAFPWSLAFLPDSAMLVTERNGGLVKIDGQGNRTEISGLPEDILVAGQGGLQEVILAPDFARSQRLFVSYAAGTVEHNTLKVISARLDGEQLKQVREIFAVQPYRDTPVHYGGRMAFLPDGTLLVTSGDGFDYREDAQRTDNQMGKILRIHQDGSFPQDNPFFDAQNPLAPAGAVYSLGHRNPQAVLHDNIRGLVFANEHGPAGGDEINLISAGNNYGWPVVTNGRDYSGASISPFREYEGMELPLLDWTPSIAPSGMAVYYGDMFSELQGDLLVTALKDKEVRWVQLSGNKVQGQQSLFKELDSRLRDIRVGPDGAIYLLSDSDDGKIFRISKAAD